MKVLKKGFTLIELLAVIIILAIVALIATPLILNVIDDAERSANRSEVELLLKGAQTIFFESKLNEDLKQYITGDNVYDIFPTTGKLPEIGSLKIENDGKIELFVHNNGVCYSKKFDEDEITETEMDSAVACVSLTVMAKTEVESIGEWYNTDVPVKIMTNGSSYKYCTNADNCIYETVNDASGEYILTEDGVNTLCIVGVLEDAETEQKCYTFKIDKTAPSITGLEAIKINLNENLNLLENVNVSDYGSGLYGSISIEPDVIDTSVKGVYEVAYTATDNASNVTRIIRDVFVGIEKPIPTFTVQGNPFNNYGWSKTDVTVDVFGQDFSGTGIENVKWCTTTSSSCTPTSKGTNTVLLTTNSETNKICAQVTDGIGQVSDIVCSPEYKIDKVVPTTGSLNVNLNRTITKGSRIYGYDIAERINVGFGIAGGTVSCYDIIAGTGFNCSTDNASCGANLLSSMNCYVYAKNGYTSTLTVGISYYVIVYM